MTQRSILAGDLPIFIHAGADVEVQGWDSDRVQAESDSKWGLKVERRSETEFGRIRAEVGDFTLLDVGLDKNVIDGLRNVARAEVANVQLGGSGKVLVPFNSQVKIYAGRSVNAHDLKGVVAAYAGQHITLRNVNALSQASAGGKLDLECEQLAEGDLKFSAGSDIRFSVGTLKDVRLNIHDLGGKWQASIGEAQVKIQLKAGGDVTIVTDQELIPLAPHYLLGKIEKRSPAGS